MRSFACAVPVFAMPADLVPQARRYTDTNDEAQQIVTAMDAAKSQAAGQALDARHAKLDACKPYLPAGADIALP